MPKGVLYATTQGEEKIFSKILNFPEEQPIMSMKAKRVLLFPKVHFWERVSWR